MDCVIGVDLGGTNVRAAAVNRAGEFMSERVERPSRAKEGSSACIAAVGETLAAVKEKCGAIGIAIPGHIDAANGVVRWAPNFGEYVGGMFRSWRNVAFVEPLRKLISKPILIGNDANLAALGEYRFGSGKNKAEGLVLFTLGTGIGSGVILTSKCLQGMSRDGETLILVGSNGGAVELGHTVIVTDGEVCSCGARGCVEAYCGTEGLLGLARAMMIEEPSPKALFEAARSGEDRARETWRRFGHYLGVAVGNAINTFAPEIVALGGQIAKAEEFFMDSVKETARANSIPSIYEDTTIMRAEKTEDAGILGAAALAFASSK